MVMNGLRLAFFLASNSIAFMLSFSNILINIPGLHHSLPLIASVCFLLVTYYIALASNTWQSDTTECIWKLVLNISTSVVAFLYIHFAMALSQLKTNKYWVDSPKRHIQYLASFNQPCPCGDQTKRFCSSGAHDE
ncbi:hypothetical protein CDL15_Pgr021478 [Punica granatum]|nr:hypothetical protein CDL15_Pgr021478 [Punica granatum]